MSLFKKSMRFFLSAALIFLWAACSNPEGKSRELYETAQFEEQQHNIEHAKQLYEEILQKYPESSLASKAKERLESLKEE